MNIKDLIKDQIKKSDSKGSQNNQLIKALLEYSANEKENDINKRLLRQLISKYALAEKQLRSLNNELIEKDQRIDIDLKAAAEIQKSLLPQTTFVVENLEIAWKFEPCEHMGGDIFNIFQMDAEHLGIYMLDVSGHGVPAAMITVSVSQFLQQNTVQMLKKSSFMSPTQVLNALDKEFPFERFNNFFTITYIIINTKNGDTIYSNAGHPYPIFLRKNETLELLKKGGPSIGMRGFETINDRKVRFEEGQLKIKPGDKLFIYTDGIVEYQNDNEEFYGDDRFYNTLKMQKNESVHNIIDQCIKSLMEFGNNTSPQDDITLLGLELK
ncbi:MAG: SpoIIE family protein phosphatase [Desulfobacteraceae bacterium]|nr:SpoIIE family protein phosphatase [Desulfobacteraceae bacterium]